MPITSRFPDIEIPNVDLWSILFERSDREYPDNKRLLTDPVTGKSHTYIQIKNAATDFGKGLQTLWRWKAGDTIVIFSPNSLDIPIAIWGAIWAGAIISPANVTYTPRELAFQLKDSNAKAIITHKKSLPVAIEAAKLVGIPSDRIILIGEDRHKSFKHYDDIRVGSQVTDNFTRWSSKVPNKDVAFLAYSSGTTGLPKGVMITHRNVVANILLLDTLMGPPNLTWNGGPSGEGDVQICFLPLFHIFGLQCVMHVNFYQGVELILMESFSMEAFCSNVQKHKATFTYVVPPVVLGLSKDPTVSRYNLSSLKRIVSAGAPLPKGIAKEAYEKLRIPISQGYGLTETCAAFTCQPWEDWQRKLGSVGVLLPNQSAKVVSPEGKEVSTGEPGEIWIKSPSNFLGYHNNPTATNACMTADGYFKTGDIGYVDEEGDFYVTDRLKELIKYKGSQVAPAELENVLLGCPDVLDVVVIGVYDASRASEVPRAYVVIKSNVSPTAETAKRIEDFVQARVASHKRLRGGVRFLDNVPKTASGKILRKDVKKMADEEAQKGLAAKL